MLKTINKKNYFKKKYLNKYFKKLKKYLIIKYI